MFVRNFGFMFEPIFLILHAKEKKKIGNFDDVVIRFSAGERIHFLNQIFSNEINPRKNFEFFFQVSIKREN